MKLIITIDTEEDGWGDYTEGSTGVSNIEMVPELQGILESFNARPTYLVSYPVAKDPKSAELFKRLVQEGKAEVGAHCHPWNTPPFLSQNGERTSMMCNLSSELQYKKLTVLHEAIIDNIGVEPTSFRAGRWAFNSDVAGNIRSLGYRVDTSITPYVDWSASYGPDFSLCSPRHYRFSTDDIFTPKDRGDLLEVPATIGFLQKDFHLANTIHRRFGTILKRTKFNGLMWRLGLINKVWLSPDVSSTPLMIKLAERMDEEGYGYINMSFHSPSLVSGLTPFTKTPGDKTAFLEKIRGFLSWAEEKGIETVTLSETGRED